MEQRRAIAAAGVLLIVAGAAALAIQFVPGWGAWFRAELGWPLVVMGVGLSLLVIGLLAGVVAMAVPAAIVGGIGAILYWQNVTGDWQSWSYVWALIPGFAGVGVILAGLLQGRLKDVGEGAWLILISLVLFAVFGSWLGGVSVFGPYWPVLIIIIGLVLLVRRVAWAG
jgi:hypothetical protein